MIGPMEIAFLGFGLIAGSIARALRHADPGGARLTAWSPSGAGARAAREDRVLDRVATSPADAVRSADLIVLAAPPPATLALLEILADRSSARLGASTVVTDVASTKRRIVERAEELGLPFVGGHPMAGLETTGYATSRADLFVDRPWVIVPAAGSEGRTGVVETLVRTVGARPIRMGAAEHDAAVAAISHLPLVLAAALVEAVAGPADAAAPDGWPAARVLAANGWGDMTRLARGDETMASGIAVTNAQALAARVRAIRTVLDEWLAELEQPGGPDEARLRARFLAARRRLDDRPS